MPIKTTWTVEHVCGHEQDHDLADRRPSDRAGFARWLATKDCSGCWRAARAKANGKEREAEAAEIEAWERHGGWPALDGSEKQVEWARRVRRDLLSACHGWWLDEGPSEDDFASQVEEPARGIVSAHWWIDQRDSAPEDLAELVADGAGAESENPY